jgi:uncharacterized membrane protein
MTAIRIWTDRRMEEVIGSLLRAGVILSAVVVLFGGSIYLTRHYSQHADYRLFHGEPADYTSIRGILHSAYGLHGQGFIQLGLLLLIATPVARVAFSIWGFAEEHDRMYVIFTVIVLTVLLYSLLGSGAAF